MTKSPAAPTIESRFATVRAEYVAAALVLVYFTVLYYPVFTSGALLAPADLALYYAPYASVRPPGYDPGIYTLSDLMDSYMPPLKMVADALLSGHLPLFNDKIQNGVPWLFVDRNEDASPFVLPFVLLLGPIVGYSISVLAKFLAGAVFFCALLRLWGVGRFAAVIGALVFVANAYPVQRLGHGLGTMYFMIPVALYGLQRALEGGSLAICITPIVLHGIYASGYPPAVAFHATLYAAFILFWLVTTPQPRMAALARISVVGVLTLALVLPGLIETYQYLIRDQEVTYRTNYWAVGFPALSVVTAFAPWAFGENGPGGFVWVRLGIYIGLAPLAAMSLAFLLPNRRKVTFLFITLFGYVTLVLFSPWFREHFYRYLPILNGTMANNQNMIYAFVACVLATLGMDQLLRSDPKSLRVAFSTFLLVCALGVAAWFARPMLALADTIKLAEAAALLVLSVTLILALAYLPRLRRPLQAAMMLLVFGDLLAMGAGYNHTVPRGLVYPETPGVSFLKSNVGDGKVFMLDTTMIADTPLWHSIRTVGGLGFFTQDTLALYRLINPNAFNANPVQFIFPANAETKLGSSLIDALGIRYIAANPDYAREKSAYLDAFRTTDGNPKFRLVHSGDMAIFENTTAMSTAFLVPTVQLAPRADIYREMASEARDLRRFAWLESESVDDQTRGVLLTNNAVPLVGTVKGGRISDSAQEFVVDASRPALLVIGDNFFDNWRVRLNGEPHALLRVDFALRGVVLPAGTSTLQLTYLPRHLQYGLPLMLLVYVGLLTASAFLWVSRSLHKLGVASPST